MIMVVAMLAVPSLLALANTLGINVLERTREIGMMRAVGATRRQVRRMIVAESLLLSAMGIAFGILAGIWMGYLLVGAMSFTHCNLARMRQD
jgi:putative ABC transport system permease protein